MTADVITHDFEDARAALSHKVGASRLWVLSCAGQEALERILAGVDENRRCMLQALSEPPLRCLDLRAAGRELRERGAVLVVDLTQVGPLCCDALRLGAHAFIFDVDEGTCVVALSRDASGALPAAAAGLDGLSQADPNTGLRALSLLQEQQRHWRVTSDAAQVVAAYLRCHPAVAELRYPGLRDDPSFEVAARTLQRGFGPIIDFCLQGGEWQRYHATTRDVREQVLDLESRLSDASGPS